MQIRNSEKRQSFRMEIRKRQTDNYKEIIRRKLILQNNRSMSTQPIQILHQLFFNITFGSEEKLQTLLDLVRANQITRDNVAIEVNQLKCLGTIFRKYGDAVLPLLEELTGTDDCSILEEFAEDQEFTEFLLFRINNLERKDYATLGVRYAKIFSQFGSMIKQIGGNNLLEISKRAFDIPFTFKSDLAKFVGVICRLLFEKAVKPVQEFMEGITSLFYYFQEQLPLNNLVFLAMFVIYEGDCHIIVQKVLEKQIGNDESTIIFANYIALEHSWILYENIDVFICGPIRRILTETKFQTNTSLQLACLKILSNLIINDFQSTETIDIMCSDLTFDLIQKISFDISLFPEFQHLLYFLLCSKNKLLRSSLIPMAKRAILTKQPLQKKVAKMFSRNLFIERMNSDLDESDGLSGSDVNFQGTDDSNSNRDRCGDDFEDLDDQFQAYPQFQK